MEVFKEHFSLCCQVFNLLPAASLPNYPYEVEDEQECLRFRSRRDVSADQTYEAFKVEKG